MSRATDEPDFDTEAAASRASAFVYGNILVLASLIALEPDQLTTAAGVGYVLGAAVSTFVAHVVGEMAGDLIRKQYEPARGFVARLRNSAPIASSASVPAVLLAAAWMGWLPGAPALIAAEIFTIGRVAFLGAVNIRFHGKQSGRAIAYGIVLAMVCAAVAGVKWWLTH